MTTQKIFGGYRILERLGRGGVGEVHRAVQQSLSREVALKTIRPEVTLDANVLSRFEREMRIAASFAHPNLVKIFDGGVREGTPFIAMELLRGETLHSSIQDHGPMEWRKALSIARGILAGLESLHDHDVLHRDVKPSNIFLTSSGGVKLLDFGAALMLEESRITSPGVLVGTVSYMAPELFLGQRASTASDLWSFGCILYEMVVGRGPFLDSGVAGILQATLERNFELPSRHDPDIPPGFDTLVLLLLELDPGSRPPDARSVLHALHAISPEESRIAIARAISSPVEADRIATPLSGTPEHARSPQGTSPTTIDPAPSSRVPGSRLLVSLVTILLIGVTLGALYPRPRPVARQVEPPAARTTPSSVPVSHQTTDPSYTGNWRELEPSLPRLMGDPTRARELVSRLRRSSRVDMGTTPQAWIYWIELCRWIDVPTGQPPRPSRSKPSQVEALFNSDLLSHMAAVDPHPPPPGARIRLPDSNGLATAVLHTMRHPDDALTWLALGRFIEADRGTGKATPVYAQGLERLPGSNIRTAPHALWTALARALACVPGHDLESEWLDIVRAQTGRENAWTGLGEAFPDNEHWVLLRRMLERGAADPRTSAEASAELGQQIWRLELNHAEASRVWELALRDHPDSPSLHLVTDLSRLGHGLLPDLASRARPPLEKWLEAACTLITASPADLDSLEIHDDQLDIAVGRLLLAADIPAAERLALRAFRRSVPSSRTRIALELASEGSQSTLVQEEAKAALVRLADGNGTSQAVGFLCGPAGTPWLERLVENLSPVAGGVAEADLLRALWHSRRSEHREALDALDRAHSAGLDVTPAWSSILEIQARPLWQFALGRDIPGPVHQRAASSPPPPEVRSLPLGALWQSFQGGNWENALKSSREAFENHPYNPVIILAYASASALAKSPAERRQVREQCRLAARFNRLGIWLEREIDELAPLR